ncbi:hypothetical protein ACJX0J_041832, partial [Zea mays]
HDNGAVRAKMEKYAAKKLAAQAKEKRAVWEWDYESFVDVSWRVMLGRARSSRMRCARCCCPCRAPARRHSFGGCSRRRGGPASSTRRRPCPSSDGSWAPRRWRSAASGSASKKCRYLESSGCVGMCVNMCKVPTQDFFTNEFGLPLTMNPSECSAWLYYSGVPPPLEEDPASKQACYPSL